MNKIFSFLLLTAISLPTTSYCEVIKLNNGDILNVVIKSQSKDALIVEHTSLGEISIEKGKIANLQSINLNTIINAEDEQVAEKNQLMRGYLARGF